MAKRIEFNYYIGLDEPSWQFEEPVIKEASRLAGGCTVQRSIGYWIEGADEPQVRYAGPLDEEFCFHLQFSVPKIEKARINVLMRSCIRQCAHRWGKAINWVHVTTHEVNTDHFQIDPGVSRMLKPEEIPT